MDDGGCNGGRSLRVKHGSNAAEVANVSGGSRGGAPGAQAPPLAKHCKNKKAKFNKKK